jgi:hypothetical protein
MEQLLGPGARAGGKAVLQSVLAGLEAERQSRRAELDKPGACLAARVARVRSTWDAMPAPRVIRGAEAGAALDAELGELRPPPGRETTRCEVSVAFEAEARVDRLACVVSAKLAEVIFDGAYVTTVRGQAADGESGLFAHSFSFSSLMQAPPLCSVLTVRFLSLQGDKDKRVVRLGPLLVDAVSVVRLGPHLVDAVCGGRAGDGSAGEDVGAQSESLESTIAKTQVGVGPVGFFGLAVGAAVGFESLRGLGASRAREESANEFLGARAQSELSASLGAKTQSESLANLSANPESESVAVARQLHLVAGNVEALSQRVGALELALQRRADETDAKLEYILRSLAGLAS